MMNYPNKIILPPGLKPLEVSLKRSFIGPDSRTKELKEVDNKNHKDKLIGLLLLSFSKNARDAAGVMMAMINPAAGLTLGLGDASISVANLDYVGGGIQAGLEVLPYGLGKASKLVSKAIPKVAKSSLMADGAIKNAALNVDLYTKKELGKVAEETRAYYNHPDVQKRAASMGLRDFFTQVDEFLVPNKQGTFEHITKGGFPKTGLGKNALGYSRVDGANKVIGINDFYQDKWPTVLKHEFNHMGRSGNSDIAKEEFEATMSKKFHYNNLNIDKLTKLLLDTYKKGTKHAGKLADYLTDIGELPVQFSAISLKRVAEGLSPYGWKNAKEFMADLVKYDLKTLINVFDSFKNKERAFLDIRLLVMAAPLVTTKLKEDDK